MSGGYHVPFTIYPYKLSFNFTPIRYPNSAYIDQFTVTSYHTVRDGIVLQDDPLHNATNSLHHFACFSSIWSLQSITR
ncbi:hypothetical protein JHK82_053799 [Glycine max]|nr:hypothetical protein JHK87_053709 [Glycine soja]KAG4928113.1 hypothetical protein JHK85_054599 [Glycine max]KAG5086402.1 hypothetical protein JHK82_053799 [Glycine max]